MAADWAGIRKVNSQRMGCARMGELLRGTLQAARGGCGWPMP